MEVFMHSFYFSRLKNPNSLINQSNHNVRRSTMRTISLVTTLLVIFLFTGCDQSNPTGVVSGTLSGQVILHQDYHQENPAQTNEGVVVSIENTNLSTVSDRNGNWAILGLIDGRYTIVITKNSYETYKRNIVYSVGAVLNIVDTLYKVPAFEVTNLSVILSGNTTVIRGNLIGTVPQNAFIRLYFSSAPNVSPNNCVFTVRENVRENGVGVATIVAFRENGSFSLQDLYNRGIVGRAYVVAYADGENPNRPVLNLQSSNVAELLVP
jgi:hypothetical protein